MKLFPYQENVLTAIETDPSHSQLISMPTGTGKTITFLNVAKNKNKKCLILVHREELLNQTYDKAKLCGIEEKDLALVKSNKKEDFRKINIAMVQTLSRNLERYNPDEIEMIIVDEAHHATAASYKKIFDFFQVFEKQKLLIGFTATPLRGDKNCLSDVFLSNSFKMTLSEATKEGYICPVHGLKIQLTKSLEDIETVQGDYDISKLDKVMNCPDVNKIIVERCTLVNRKPGLIFCTSINHAKELARLLREQKKKAISISHETPKKTLEKIYKMLHRGSIDYITNAVKLSEGFDYPPIEVITIARPTRSPVLYKQMIGRGLRKFKNKHDCLVLEFSGSDPNMMTWDEIDENCTFQSIDPKEKLTREEAMKKFFSTFSDKIKVIDIRLSPFNFYECYLKRKEKYKDFYFCPGENEFNIFKIIRAKSKHGYGNYYHILVWQCIWRKYLEDFYVWSSGSLFHHPEGRTLDQLKHMMDNFIEFNSSGKWYPSDNEQMTPRQKKILGDNANYSSRKAEFLIEDKYFKKLIQKEWIEGKYNDDKSTIDFYLSSFYSDDERKKITPTVYMK